MWKLFTASNSVHTQSANWSQSATATGGQRVHAVQTVNASYEVIDTLLFCEFLLNNTGNHRCADKDIYHTDIRYILTHYHLICVWKVTPPPSDCSLSNSLYNSSILQAWWLCGSKTQGIRLKCVACYIVTCTMNLHGSLSLYRIYILIYTYTETR